MPCLRTALDEGQPCSAIPVVPRTRRQKARANWLVFNSLPHSQITSPESERNQQLAGVPPPRGTPPGPSKESTGSRTGTSNPDWPNYRRRIPA